MHFNSIMTQWRTVPAGIKMAIGCVFIAVLGTAIVVAIVSQRPHGLLFASPLHVEQLSEVEERLAEWNEPFTPTADNVIVDASRRNALLLRLSLSGVPHAHVADSSERLATIGA